jgi:hypothetical protein
MSHYCHYGPIGRGEYGRKRNSKIQTDTQIEKCKKTNPMTTFLSNQVKV